MVYALRYRELVQKRRVYIALVILWISSITISNSHLTWFWSPPRERDAYDRMLSIVLLVAFALLPSLVITIQYTYIYFLVKKLLRSTPGTSEAVRKKKELKALMIYCLMFISLVVLVFPYFIMRVIMEFIDYRSLPNEIMNTFMIMRFLVSIVNPMLYTLLKRDFRKAFMGCILCVKERRRTISRGSTMSRYTIRSRLSSVLSRQNGTVREHLELDPICENKEATVLPNENLLPSKKTILVKMDTSETNNKPSDI